MGFYEYDFKIGEGDSLDALRFTGSLGFDDSSMRDFIKSIPAGYYAVSVMADFAGNILITTLEDHLIKMDHKYVENFRACGLK